MIVFPAFASLNSTESIAPRRVILENPALLRGSDFLSHLIASNDSRGTRLGDFFVLLGSQSFEAYLAYRSTCAKIATSDRMADRIWCMLTGYAVGAMSILTIAVLGEAGLGRIPAGVAAQVRQHATFLKLCFFMTLELVVFPLGIGMVIDASTVPLFADANLIGRLLHLREAPFGVLFVSWLVGTLSVLWSVLCQNILMDVIRFMFTFANILGHIRTVSAHLCRCCLTFLQMCRPGALFFIRDPADQNYSPVKDIIERPAGSQLRKVSDQTIESK